MLSAFFWIGRRRVHVSVCIAFLCVGIIGGVGLARVVAPGLFGAVAWVLIGSVVAAFGVWRQRYATLVAVVIGGVLCGLWRGSVVAADLAQYQPLYGQVVSVTANVQDDPDVNAQGALILKLNNVYIEGRHYGGTIWVSTTPKPVKRSDRVTLNGRFNDGFGTFAATMYRAHLTTITRERGGDPAGAVRDGFADMIRKSIAEPQASLGIGYLVGQKSALPADLAAAFVTAGLTHVVVASGYNLTILVRLARRLFVRVSKYLSVLAAAGMILGFMAVTGLSPSMSRAGLVAGLSLLTWAYGRSVHPLVLLPFAAAITLLVNPSYGWGDLGWALSFASFAGVMIIAPLLQAYFFGEKKPWIVRQIMGETLAATIATLPVLVLAFGQFSNVSLITNLLILPLVPLAMLLTFIAGIGAIAVPGLAPLIGTPAEWLLAYMTNVATYFANLSWATSSLTITPIVMVVAYLGLGAACVYLWRATRADLGSENLVI